MNDHTAGYAELPRTAYLENTLRRARTAAEQRSHRYVTIEHLLLALLDDHDAVKLIQLMGADLPLIKSSVADIVNNRMGALAVPDGRAPTFSYKFDALFLGASQEALGAGRREVDGALVLIAVAKERGSDASAILTANGFRPERASQALAPAKPAGHPQQGPTRGAPPAGPAAPLATQAKHASPSPDNSFMEDMLTSVRNILDAEENNRGPSPGVPAALPASRPPAPQPPRLEPQFKGDLAAMRGGGREDPGLPPQAAGPVQARSDPYVRPEPGLPLGQLGGRPQTGPSLPALEPLAVDADPRLPADRFQGKKVTQNRRDRHGRRQGEQAPPGLERILDAFPRRFRKSSRETVQIQLKPEEAHSLFARAQRRGHPQFGENRRAACRAVTVRVAAPEGGLAVETLYPETQWILDHASRHGQEDFGHWAWSILPEEKGSFPLTLSMTARDIDGGGNVGDLALPEQSVRVRVKGSALRAMISLLNGMLLLVAGSGLTVGAWYALKVMGKLPH